MFCFVLYHFISFTLSESGGRSLTWLKLCQSGDSRKYCLYNFARGSQSREMGTCVTRASVDECGDHSQDLNIRIRYEKLVSF